MELHNHRQSGLYFGFFSFIFSNNIGLNFTIILTPTAYLSFSGRPVLALALSLFFLVLTAVLSGSMEFVASCPG